MAHLNCFPMLSHLILLLLNSVVSIHILFVQNTINWINLHSLIWVSDNHVSLQEIYQISNTGHGSFLNGLGKLFGITINSLAKGGTKIITAVGRGLKQGFQVMLSETQLQAWVHCVTFVKISK